MTFFNGVTHKLMNQQHAEDDWEYLEYKCEAFLGTAQVINHMGVS